MTINNIGSFRNPKLPLNHRLAPTGGENGIWQNHPFTPIALGLCGISDSAGLIKR
ncbi:MAG: hypothetical protein IPN94_22810 [Sphingobacteriales bacterium]|nr:hypothetical protein [Sphingobacteriales bacterium]